MKPAPPVTSARTAAVSHRVSRAVEESARGDDCSGTDDSQGTQHRTLTDQGTGSDDRELNDGVTTYLRVRQNHRARNRRAAGDTDAGTDHRVGHRGAALDPCSFAHE